MRAGSGGHERPRPTEDEDRHFMLRSPPAPKSRLPALYRAQEHGFEYDLAPVSDRERPRWSASFEDRGVLPCGHARREIGEIDATPCDDRYRVPEGYTPPAMARPHRPIPAGRSHADYGMVRPRLYIHPYSPPIARASEPRYYSAGDLRPRQSLPAPELGFCPASAISPASFKAPRKRGE